jgi:hypothetical protein
MVMPPQCHGNPKPLPTKAKAKTLLLKKKCPPYPPSQMELLMRGQDENLQPSSPKTLGQILETLPAALSSGLSLKPNGDDSLTIGSGAERPGPIGRPVSEHGLETLRNFARSVSRGKLLNDRDLEALLTQHFGSERFVAKEKLKHSYGPNGYECESAGYELSLDHLHDGEMKIFDAIDFLNKPATPVLVAKLVARMRSVLARRNDNADDMVLLIDTYADHLEKYPPDVVATVIHEIISTRTWFPKIVELRAEMDKMVRFRRAVLDLFLRKRGEAQARLLASG